MKIAEKDEFLEKEFDFSKAIKNPYARELKKQITIKITPAVIDYFKEEATETGIPYRTLIEPKSFDRLFYAGRHEINIIY